MSGVSGNGHGTDVSGPLRIALLAPPMEPVPPRAYGGTERIIAALADELGQRGHEVTLYASGDSAVRCRLEPIVPQALWAAGYRGDVSPYIAAGIARCWADADRFDIVHSHVEGLGFLMARHARVPVLSTLHGRLDGSGMPELLETFGEVPLVAISDSQRRWAPGANWVATIHHGLPLADMPFSARPGEYLLFVGRCTPEKGVADAIEAARRSQLRLRMAAKVYDATETAHFEQVVRPAMDAGLVEFLGEVPPTERDPLYAGALATLMLGPWPEPFGLVAIESLGTGTPVIARRAGALPEIVEHGVDGYLVDDVSEVELALRLVRRLERAQIRRRALERFSAARMTDQYEAVYRRLIAARRGDPRERTRAARAPAPAEVG